MQNEVPKKDTGLHHEKGGLRPVKKVLLVRRKTANWIWLIYRKNGKKRPLMRGLGCGLDKGSASQP